MFAAGLELISDESDSVEIHTHGEFLVLFLRLAAACTFLCQCLMIQRKCKTYERPDLSRVEFAVESAKLDGAVVCPRSAVSEKRVQVQKVITAVVIAGCAVVPAVFLVPNRLNRLEMMGFNPIQLLDQKRVHFLAVPLPVGGDLQGFVQQIIFACDDVDEVADTPRGVVAAIQVNMNIIEIFR